MISYLRWIGVIVVWVVGLQFSVCELAIGKDTVTIEFMNMALSEKARAEKAMRVFNAFEKKHGVKLKYTIVDFNDILPQTMVRAAAGNAPDLAHVGDMHVPFLVMQGGVQPLDVYDPAFLKEFIPGSLDLFKKDGKVYGLSWGLAHHTMWFDRGLLKRAGYDPNNEPLGSAHEFKEAARKIHALGGNIFGMGYDTRNHTFGLTDLWVSLRLFGGHILDDKGKVDFNTPEVKDLFSFIQEMCGPGSGYKLNNLILREIRAAAGRRQVGFMVDGPHLRTFARAANSELNDPHKFWEEFGASTKTPSVAVDGHALVMFKQSKHKKQVWALMKFLNESDIGVKYLSEAGLIPPLTNSYEKMPELLEDPMINTYVKQIIPKAKPVNPAVIPNYATTARVVMAGIQKLVAGEDVDSVVERVQIQLEAIMGQ
jgi:multiple sugar transport system substrate-binding protein